MAIIVVASILLTAVPASILVYYYAYAKILDNEISKLLEITHHQADTATERFLEAKPKLEGLSRLLQKELDLPIKAAEIAEFHRVMERNADGVWRNRRSPYNGSIESGVFLPPNSLGSDKQKIMHMRIKRVMDFFGSAASKHLENVWYLSPQRSEIIFDATFPNFVFDQNAANDYTATPWVRNTSPEQNPQRTFGFTPPLFDPVPKVWMVSAIYPLYLDGQWLGTLGEDMQLSNVLAFVFQNQQLYAGTQHFLLDNQGNFILAGNWQQALEATPDSTNFDLGKQPELKALLQSPLQDSPRLLSDAIVVDGKNYVVIGMALQPVDWRYFKLVPVDEIMQSTRQLFFSLVVIICFVSIISGLLISAAVHRNVVKRIRLLAEAMRLYESGEKQHVTHLLPGTDEISVAAQEFEVMMERIDMHVLEIQVTKDTLQASEERWKFALEGAGDGVWDWNIADNTVFFSKKWKEMLGYAEDEIGSELFEWEKRVHPEDLASTFAAVRDYLDGKTPLYINEHRMLCKNGSYTWILDRGMVVSCKQTGKPMRLIGTHTDISQAKQTEHKLQQARDVAEAHTRSKSEFLANMSHEIRTPMNGVIGLSTLALNKPMSDEVRDYLQKISSSSESLLDILNDILDFSKIETGKLSVEHRPFNLHILLDNLRNLFSVGAKEKHLKFSIEIISELPVDLIGDALRLRQILSNLLGNAIKFTAQGQVTLKVQLLNLEPDQARVRFSVEDTGIGISQDNQVKLFLPYSQVDSSITRRFGGTGLGLAISHSLLQLMGSDFRIESLPGVGSRFSFELVLGVSALASQHVAELPRPALVDSDKLLAGRRILVAEDNLINQQVVGEFLKLSGITVTIANNGIEALDLLEHGEFDAVLMDMHMPEMDGFEATKLIRSQARFARLPVIALTAGVTKEEKDRCMATGMNDFIAKPINPEKLIATLLQWLLPVVEQAETVKPFEEKQFGSLDLPGFDLQNLLVMLGNNQQLTTQMLFDFMASMKTVSFEIEALLTAGDLASAKELAHKIKGVSGNIGAVQLYAAAEALENELYNGSSANFKAFNTAFNQAIAAIATMPKPEQLIAATLGNAGALTRSIAELDGLLKNNDFISEALLNTLKLDLPVEQLDLFAQLCRQVSDLNYPQARKFLSQLAELCDNQES